MQILDILSPDRVQTGVAVGSKKRALEHAARAVEKAIGGNELAGKVFDALLARERLGSTALGEGVAVPHCRLPDCRQTIGLLLKLAEGIDFDAPDNKPVDLLFVLVVPQEATDEHLQLLGRVAGMFNDGTARAALRSADSGSELYERVQAFERDAASG
ncbi:MAG: PTS sugar transporter subunit IIA [Pseudomonadota bacterium]